MPTFLSHVVRPARWLAARPRLWAPAALLLAVLCYLGWRGGTALWVRLEVARTEQALAAYDFADARRRLDRCLRLRPDDLDLRLLAARTARRDGDLDAARRLLDRFPYTTDGPPGPADLERQLVTAQEGRVSEVVRELIDAIEVRHPQSEAILEALAMGCAQNYESAQTGFWIDMLLERWPGNGIGRLLKAHLKDWSDREASLGMLRALAADLPRFYRARLALADALYKSQRYREAVAEYRALYEQRPDELAPLLGLASCYVRLNDPDVAAPLVARLRERYPDDSDVLLESGRFALARQDPTAAEPLLRRAVELVPQDHEAHRELAVCLEQLGRTDEARRHVDALKRIEADLILLEKTVGEVVRSPNDPAPRRRAGEICLRNGQTAEGLRWLYGVLDLAPNDREAHRLLGEYWAGQGDPRRAAEHFRRSTTPAAADPRRPGGP